MGEYNGNSFEMGLLWGKLQEHMRHHGVAIERQNEILLDIKDTLTDMPHQIATRIGTPVSASVRPPPEPGYGSLIRVTVESIREAMPSTYEVILAAIAVAISIGWIVPDPSPPGTKSPTHTAE